MVLDSRGPAFAMNVERNAMKRQFESDCMNLLENLRGSDIAADEIAATGRLSCQLQTHSAKLLIGGPESVAKTEEKASQGEIEERLFSGSSSARQSCLVLELHF